LFTSFFFSKKWILWSWGGSFLILLGSWIQVEIDVRMNEWFGQFYNTIQQALSSPNSIEINDYYRLLLDIFILAGKFIFIAVILSFFAKHWVFRWRQAMTIYFLNHWQELRHIEGASQRIQEDTKRFANIMESLGSSFIESILVLLAFIPILWHLSDSINILPLIGKVDHAPVFATIFFAIFGTIALGFVGIKLPGLEFNNQRVEAAFRKELVLAEDSPDRGEMGLMRGLFDQVRMNYFRLFFHYLYFDVAKVSYLQAGVILPYVILAPTIVAGIISLGVMQQIIRAFYRVLDSFQFLVKSWPTIVELISVFKRLRAFEKALKIK
jgi:peptide/bleomycin uptake transporter